MVVAATAAAAPEAEVTPINQYSWSDRDAKVRFTALRALERIDRNAAVNAAKGLQSDPDRNVRRAASELVGQ